MQAMLNIATTAAIAAGKLIAQHYDRLDTLKIGRKSANNFVTNVDHLAEQCIIEHIQQAYPEHKIIAEESGTQGNHEYCWIIDPLDGTSNFIHGYPHFAISIALQYKTDIVAGVIYNPLTHELFSAIRGSGARLNNQRIRVSSVKTLADSLVNTGILTQQTEVVSAYTKTLNVIMQRTSAYRVSGSAALDLAYIAAGRSEAFWQDSLYLWDIAAGILLIEEAGGRVTDGAGNALAKTTDHLNIVASNKHVHSEFLSILNPSADTL